MDKLIIVDLFHDLEKLIEQTLSVKVRIFIDNQASSIIMSLIIPGKNPNFGWGNDEADLVMYNKHGIFLRPLGIGIAAKHLSSFAAHQLVEAHHGIPLVLGAV